MLTSFKMYPDQDEEEMLRWKMYYLITWKVRADIFDVIGDAFQFEKISGEAWEQISGALHVRHSSSVGAVRYGFDAWGDY